MSKQIKKSAVASADTKELRALAATAGIKFIGKKVEDLRVELMNIAVDDKVKPAKKANTMLSAVRQIEILNKQVKDYIYPKLYTLYNEKKLNKGHLPPHRSAKESISIQEISSDDEKITVQISIWWGGDCTDEDYVSLTCDEWDSIQNCR